ncbi:MAG: DUF975 family protein [Mogibacterium sp.]|nr:DUF975 family protein [Mogibacterium sp.]
MWDRKQVKETGKAAFKANYWRCVLVALILSLIAGASAASGGATGSSIGQREGIKNEMQEEIQDDIYDDIYDMDEDFDMDQFLEDNPDINIEDLEVEGTSAVISRAAVPSGVGEGLMTGGIIIFVVIILILAMAVALAFSILVVNPLALGCNKFFYSNLDAPAEVGEVGFGFSKNYGNYVKALLLTDVYTVLWSFLFIIPGIIKGFYSYRMVPFILIDNPDIGAKAAVTKSREMMNGHKWRAFVYDLSFLGWILLSILTLGLLSIFYVGPYKRSSDAQLYKAIRDCDSMQYDTAPATNVETPSVIETTVETTTETNANNGADVL